jgi:hypothetical protein
MPDGDRSTGFKHPAWAYATTCRHGLLLAEPCEGCRRCVHGVSAFGGVPCPACDPEAWARGVPREVRRDLVLGDDEPGLDLWREYAATFASDASVDDGEDDVGCDGPYDGERVEMARAR